MVDQIQNVTAIIEQDPNLSRTGQVDREKSPGKDKSTREVSNSSAKNTEPSAPKEVGVNISDVVKDLNTLVYQVATTKVSFDVDKDTGRSVVRVLNKETGEIVRQVPPEELLTLVARMRQLSGLIFNKQV